jgi:hypothetical protein
VKKEETFSQETSAEGPSSSAPSKPSLDLAFKEGQTIRVNLNIDRKKEKPAARSGGAGLGLLPPPPGAPSLPALRPAPRCPFYPFSISGEKNVTKLRTTLASIIKEIF